MITLAVIRRANNHERERERERERQREREREREINGSQARKYYFVSVNEIVCLSTRLLSLLI